MSGLGSQTFAIQRWPEIQFGNNSDWQKYRRRKFVTLEQGRQVAEKATLAVNVGIEGDFWRGQVSTRYAKTSPSTQLLGETAGSFPARNWEIEDGRILTDNDVDDAREVCVLGSALAKTSFSRSARPWARKSKSTATNIWWSACWRRRAVRWADNRTILPSSPSPRRSTATAAGGTT